MKETMKKVIKTLTTKPLTAKAIKKMSYQDRFAEYSRRDKASQEELFLSVIPMINVYDKLADDVIGNSEISE